MISRLQAEDEAYRTMPQRERFIDFKKGGRNVLFLFTAVLLASILLHIAAIHPYTFLLLNTCILMFRTVVISIRLINEATT